MATVWRSGEGFGNKVYFRIGKNRWESRWLKIKNVNETKLMAISKGITGGHESILTIDLETRSGAFTESVESWTRFISEPNQSITKILLKSCQIPGED